MDRSVSKRVIKELTHETYINLESLDDKRRMLFNMPIVYFQFSLKIFTNRTNVLGGRWGLIKRKIHL